MQCHTDLIFVLVVVESIFRNSQGNLLYRYLRQSFELDQPVFQFLPRCQVPNLWTHLYLMLWSLPKMNVSLFGIWTTLDCKSLLMRGGLQLIKARSGLLLGISLDMHSCGHSIYTAELKRPAAVASFVLFVVRFFVILQNMGPAQWGNSCLQKLTSQS